VCFITSTGGRQAFLGARLATHPGEVVDARGSVVGAVDAVELVTIGQRRGLGLRHPAPAPAYAVAVDVAARTVTVGGPDELLAADVRLERLAWADRPVAGPVLAQCSAHGPAHPARFDPATAVLTWDEPQRRVAPGQLVALYAGDLVLGCGTAT
jgi:tRNA-specific 2-thiouridylase